MAQLIMGFTAASILFAAAPALRAQDASAAPTAQRSGTPTLQEHFPRYTIQRQDELSLRFPLTTELDGIVKVQPDGYIRLNGASSIHVAGLTVPEAETAIKKAYAGILNNPIVNIDIRDFQKPFFSVLGQVGKPGQYELRSDLNVVEAIAQAGGLANTAKYQVFLFHRTSPEFYRVEKIDMKQLLKGKNLTENARLQPGDMLIVPESGLTTFRKYVPYTVGASYFGNY